MNNKSFLISYKVFFALLGLFAVGLEIFTLQSRDTFNFGNFFSFFTIQSNVFAQIMLLVSAVALYVGKTSQTLQYFRGASTLYMVITGVIFAVLLSGYDPRLLTAVPIDNTILHYIMPVVMVIDWLVDPPAKRLSFTRSLVWILYPLVYLVYTLIRGPIVDWYPYPFLNPATNNGYMGIAVTAVIISLFVIAVAWLMTRIASPRFKK